MKTALGATGVLLLLASTASAGSRGIEMSANPQPARLGATVRLNCQATGDWDRGLRSAKITIHNVRGETLVREQDMLISDYLTIYDFAVPGSEAAGAWSFSCFLEDNKRHHENTTGSFSVAVTGGGGSPPAVHQSIEAYDGPQTCVACHAAAASEMLDSLHMKWSGPTPELSNTGGEELGKAIRGINTFCTYAMTSKGACFGCHIRADGNAPHPPQVNDVDCLMCHNDTYQRKFLQDPNNSATVTNVLGETRTYVFGAVDASGNYTTIPDYETMPPGTTMVQLAQNVRRPTRKSCLRCHAKAGGGDWSKRGDMGSSTVAPSVTEDVHMSSDPGGANLSCTDCHAASGHKIGGRGIDLRQTEAPDPTCYDCHTYPIHHDVDYDRHAQGQVSCQACHIRTFGKGGATEMSRDWRHPHWNPAFYAGQGGFVGLETKVADVAPEYVWFDGTSYVYNVGDSIEPDERGVYPMAVANGRAFDDKSQIVPIKRHFSTMPLHESGIMVPPAIMWMFMTGDFDQAVTRGMQDHGLAGNYSIVDADAEMLITHGVEPASMAVTCGECHDYSGETRDGTGVLPLTQLGYHTWPAEVKECTLCHKRQSLDWQPMHAKHAKKMGAHCSGCHTTGPTGLVESLATLCDNCHRMRHDSDLQHLHKKHTKHTRGVPQTLCVECHTF